MLCFLVALDMKIIQSIFAHKDSYLIIDIHCKSFCYDRVLVNYEDFSPEIVSTIVVNVLPILDHF